MGAAVCVNGPAGRHRAGHRYRPAAGSRPRPTEYGKFASSRRAGVHPRPAVCPPRRAPRHNTVPAGRRGGLQAARAILSLWLRCRAAYTPPLHVTIPRTANGAAPGTDTAPRRGQDPALRNTGNLRPAVGRGFIPALRFARHARAPRHDTVPAGRRGDFVVVAALPGGVYAAPTCNDTSHRKRCRAGHRYRPAAGSRPRPTEYGKFASSRRAGVHPRPAVCPPRPRTGSCVRSRRAAIRRHPKKSPRFTTREIFCLIFCGSTGKTHLPPPPE